MQIARAAGAIVFATCSARSREFVAELGVDRVIGYREEDAIDVVCREARGWWRGPAELHFVFTPPRRATLDRLRVLLESGAVRPLIDSVLPLDQAPTALERLEVGGVRGKIALTPPSA